MILYYASEGFGMPMKKEYKEWFDELEEILNKKKEEIKREYSVQYEKKAELNKELLQDFWKIWIRFNDENIHFKMEPHANSWAKFINNNYPYEWVLREDFNFAAVDQISLTDTTRDQNRAGDSIRIIYHTGEEGEMLRIIFEFCEGEKYYKYSGWKRIYSQYILYEASVKDANLDEMRKVLKDVIARWYESHLRRKREIIINYVKDTFKKGTSFTE